MFATADLDEDGQISFDEFCALIARCDLHPTMCRYTSFGSSNQLVSASV